MNKAILILTIMIFYDFYLHLIEIFYGSQEKAMHKWYYWPPAKLFRNTSQNFYNIFWAVYWGIAFVLALYLLINLSS